MEFLFEPQLALLVKLLGIVVDIQKKTGAKDSN